MPVWTSGFVFGFVLILFNTAENIFYHISFSIWLIGAQSEFVGDDNLLTEQHFLICNENDHQKDSLTFDGWFSNMTKNMISK